MQLKVVYLDPKPLPIAIEMMRRPRGLTFLAPIAPIALITLIALIAGAVPARAQSIGNLLPLALPGFAASAGVTAASRLHPENAPQGIVIPQLPADLIAYPTLATSLGADSAPGVGQPASGLLTARPSLRIEDATLGLVAYAAADLARYHPDTAANANDITAGLGTSIPLGNDTITIGAARIATHESALGIVQSGAAQPTGVAPFSVVVTDGRIADRIPLGSFDATVRLELSHTALGDTTSTIPAAFKSANHSRATATLATRAGGMLRCLVQIEASTIRYQGAAAATGFSNANAIKAAAGLTTDPASIVRLRLIAGVVHQSFTAPTPQPAITPIVSAGIGWTPDPLLSLDLEVARQAGLDTTLGTPGSAVTTANLAIAEDYAPDLQFAATLAARTGTVAHRTASERDATIGLIWHITRAIALDPALSYASRRNLPGSAPHEARVTASLIWAP